MLKSDCYKFLVFLFFFSSCAYFADEEETILPGKRESIYSSSEEVILKAKKKIKLSQPKTVSNWSQQHQNVRNHLFHFESKSILKLKKKII